MKKFFLKLTLFTFILCQSLPINLAFDNEKSLNELALQPTPSDEMYPDPTIISPLSDEMYPDPIIQS